MLSRQRGEMDTVRLITGSELPPKTGEICQSVWWYFFVYLKVRLWVIANGRFLAEKERRSL